MSHINAEEHCDKSVNLTFSFGASKHPGAQVNMLTSIQLTVKPANKEPALKELPVIRNWFSSLTFTK